MIDLQSWSGHNNMGDYLSTRIASSSQFKVTFVQLDTDTLIILDFMMFHFFLTWTDSGAVDCDNQKSF